MRKGYEPSLNIQVFEHFAKLSHLVYHLSNEARYKNKRTSKLNILIMYIIIYLSLFPLANLWLTMVFLKLKRKEQRRISIQPNFKMTDVETLCPLGRRNMVENKWTGYIYGVAEVHVYMNYIWTEMERKENEKIML